jgi:hypothetical protein
VWRRPRAFRSIGIRLTATPSVGIPPYDILNDGPLLRETLLRLADTGVSVLDTEFLRFEPEHPLGIPEGFLEVSARLGARNVLVMSAEPQEARTIERFCELCDRAAPYGLHVGLEFAIYTGVRTLADAVRVVTQSGRAKRVGPDRRSALQPVGRNARSRRARRCIALPIRADLRCLPDMPGPRRHAQTHPRGPHGATPSRRGRPAAGRTRGGLARALPLAVEAPCRATADLPAVERAKRAHQALAALLQGREE